MQKTCKKCQVSKPLSDFSKNKTAKFGVTSSCKVCQSVYNKEYREKNLDALLQADRDRYANNTEELKAKSSKHKSENKDYYYEYNKLYYRLKKHKFLAANSKRRKIIVRATPIWLTPVQKQQIEDVYWLAQDLKVTSGETYHVDHIVPLQGKDVCGLHVPWNLQILPSDLNLKKGNRCQTQGSGAGIDVSSHPEVIKDLMAIAELEYNPDVGLNPSETGVNPTGE